MHRHITASSFLVTLGFALACGGSAPAPAPPPPPPPPAPIAAPVAAVVAPADAAPAAADAPKDAPKDAAVATRDPDEGPDDPDLVCCQHECDEDASDLNGWRLAPAAECFEGAGLCAFKIVDDKSCSGLMAGDFKKGSTSAARPASTTATRPTTTTTTRPTTTTTRPTTTTTRPTGSGVTVTKTRPR